MASVATVRLPWCGIRPRYHPTPGGAACHGRHTDSAAGMQYTDEQGQRWELPAGAAVDMDGNALYVQHALCAVSRFPLWRALRNSVRDLAHDHQGRLTTALEPSLRHILRNVHTEATVRAAACTSHADPRFPQALLPPPYAPLLRQAWTTRAVSRWERHPQPYLSPDVPITFLCVRAGVAGVVAAVGALLSQRPVLVHARDPALLTPACEALLALLYPLVWEDVYVPVLPASLAEMVQAPAAFLIGYRTPVVAA
jgi:hypothetical protein